VLNINGTQKLWENLSTDDKTIVEQLINGSGIRFKVIGNGKPWSLVLRTGSGAYYAVIRATANKIVEIDIPYSKLRQPSWKMGNTDVLIKFDKNRITTLYFVMGDVDLGSGGNYSIKIFDIEIY